MEVSADMLRLFPDTFARTARNPCICRKCKAPFEFFSLEYPHSRRRQYESTQRIICPLCGWDQFETPSQGSDPTKGLA